MHAKFETTKIYLTGDDVFRLHDPAGTEIRCAMGAVWVTQLGDQKDYCLSAGASLTLASNELALVTPLKASAIIVSAPAEAGAVPLRVCGGILQKCAAVLRRALGRAVGRTAAIRPFRLPA